MIEPHPDTNPSSSSIETESENHGSDTSFDSAQDKLCPTPLTLICPRNLRAKYTSQRNGPVRFGRPFSRAIKSLWELGSRPRSGRLRLTLMGYSCDPEMHSCTVTEPVVPRLRHGIVVPLEFS